MHSQIPAVQAWAYFGGDTSTHYTEYMSCFNLLKTEFKENADIEILVDFLYEPKLRIAWDKVLKNVEVLEGEKKTNYVCSTWAKSPTFFMSDRESLEKRCSQNHKLLQLL